MKKVIIVLIIIILTSCNTTKEENSIKSDNREAVVTQLFAHFNNHDWEAMSKMYSQVADFKDPSLGPGVVTQTREQTRMKYSELNAVFPDIHDSIIAMYPSGKNVIIVEFIASGTFPDNTKFELPICGIMTIENGLITKDYAYFDNFDETGPNESFD